MSDVIKPVINAGNYSNEELVAWLREMSDSASKAGFNYKHLFNALSCSCEHLRDFVSTAEKMLTFLDSGQIVRSECHAIATREDVMFLKSALSCVGGNLQIFCTLLGALELTWQKKRSPSPEDHPQTQTIQSDNNPLTSAHIIMDDEPVGSRIQLARENLGLSESDLARRINTYSDHVSDWECGTHEPPASVIMPLANVLKCDPMWLLTGKSATTAEES